MKTKDYKGGSHFVTEDSTNDITKISHSVTTTEFNIVFQRKLDTGDSSNDVVLLADGTTTTSIINSIKTSTTISMHNSRCGSHTSATLEAPKKEPKERPPNAKARMNTKNVSNLWSRNTKTGLPPQ